MVLIAFSQLATENPRPIRKGNGSPPTKVWKETKKKKKSENFEKG